MFRLHTLIIMIVLIITMSATASFALQKNGFDLSNSIIDSRLILSGGPPKDGIPALDEPRFLDSSDADFLRDDDRVLGVAVGSTAKAYPIRILNWHEVVNDRIADTPFIVSFCPLCGTGAVFSATVGGDILDFGVSGLLYNSDVLLYDRQTQSLWSQIRGQSISGSYVGTELVQLPTQHTTWKRWREQYPETTVLSTDTGYVRDYSRNPYGDYISSRQLYFPVEHEAENDLHPKETVLGITIGESRKAYPFTVLQTQGKERFQDNLNGQSFTVIWDEEGHSAQAIDSNGQPLEQIQGFWFAWYAFHPTTQVYTLP